MEEQFTRRSMFEGERWWLLNHLCHYVRDVPGTVVEVGCNRCGVTAWLATHFSWRTVIGFDRFEAGLSAPGPHDMPASQSYHEGAQGSDFDEARRFLGKCGALNARLVRGDVMETLAQEPPYQLALAVIDLNLHAPTLHALHWAWARLSPGGYLAVDDVGFPGIDKALEDFGQPCQKRNYMATIHKSA